MAQTAFATGNALTKKKWDEKLFRDTMKESYWMSRFGGSGSDSPLQTKENLAKGKGDQLYFGIRMRLSGSGVTSGQALEGNEEALTTYSHSVSLEEYAHAVRNDGPLTNKRAMFSIDAESAQALEDWGAEKIDELCFTEIQNAPTRIFYDASGTRSNTATVATATANIAATDLINTNMISYVKTWAKTGGNRTQTPIRPIMVDGKAYYILLVHDDVMTDLFNDSTFAQARREAEVRGKENPIFSGAGAIWNGVVIHSHENISIATNWGSGGNVPGAKNVFFGAQALCWAWGERPKAVSETFDYGRQHGFAWSMMAGVQKPTFNSKDYGSVAVYTARTQISDVTLAA